MMKRMLPLMIAAPFFGESLVFGKDYPVSQKNKAFSAEEITIAPGDSVIFKNDDDTSHNVFAAAEGLKFNLGIQKQGTETSQKFDAAGTYEIRCAIHPKMKLKVNVK